LQFEPAARERAAAEQRGGWVLILHENFINPSPAGGGFFAFKH